MDFLMFPYSMKKEIFLREYRNSSKNIQERFKYCWEILLESNRQSDCWPLSEDPDIALDLRIILLDILTGSKTIFEGVQEIADYDFASNNVWKYTLVGYLTP